MRQSSHLRFDTEGEAWVSGHVGILVDDEDWERVRQRLWYPLHQGKRTYMTCETPERDYLHRFIMQAAPDEHTHHVNGDGLDCRRSNMRNLTPRKHALEHHAERSAGALRRWAHAR